MGKLIGCIAALAAAFFTTPAIAAAPGWTISQVTGPAYVILDKKTQKAASGKALPPGAILKTGPRSRAVLVRGEEFVVVSPDSQLRLPPRKQSEGLVQIFQDFGRALFKIEKKAKAHFSVQTPYLAAVVKGTTFRISVDRRGALVRVAEGAVSTTTRNGKVSRLVQSGMEAAVTASRLDRISLQAAGQEDAEATTAAGLVQAVSSEAATATALSSSPAPAALGFMHDVNATPGIRILLGVLAVLAGALVSIMLLVKAHKTGGAGLALADGWGSGAAGSVADQFRSFFQPAGPDAQHRIGRINVRQAITATPEPRVAAMPSAPAEEVPMAAEVARAAPVAEAPREEPLGRRKSKRSRVLLAATIVGPEGETVARLHDVSNSGAEAEASAAPSAGSRVVFTCGPVSTHAEVVWVKDGRFGLKFDDEVDASSLLINLRRSR